MTHAILFFLLAGLTGISAVAVVVSQNIVRAATWLLFTLAGTAGIFFQLGADFLGATQILVYVGGTLVLVVFGVMLTAQTPFINMRINAAEWAIGLGVGLLFFGVLALCVIVSFPPDQQAFATSGEDSRPMPGDSGRSLLASKQMGSSLLGARNVTPDAPRTGVPKVSPEDREKPRSQRQPTLASLERRKMSYLLPFEIVSVHLLVVLIGAAYLARAKRRRGVQS